MNRYLETFFIFLTFLLLVSILSILIQALASYSGIFYRLNYQVYLNHLVISMVTAIFVMMIDMWISYRLDNRNPDDDSSIIDKFVGSIRGVHVTYLVLFLVVASFTIFIVTTGWTQKPNVRIQFNVGEIIGGLLVGVGAASAGIAYTVNLLKEEES